MDIKHIDRPFELKSISSAGIFEGYVSVFNNVDLGGDVILPGAFTDSLAAWKAKGALPPVLWQHRTGEVVGPFLEMREDSVGLWVKGQLLINDIARAKEAYALLQAKAINGMSIGYVSRDDSYDRLTDVRTLKKVDIYEGSIVTFPMNPMASVNSVKSRLAALESLADVEALLRDAGGFSKAEAVALVARIKSLSARGEPEPDGGLLQGLDALHKSLSGRSESDQLGDLLQGLQAFGNSLN